MFPDTDLPLALVMEEILGWEKKPDNKTADEEKADTSGKNRGGEGNTLAASACP